MTNGLFIQGDNVRIYKFIDAAPFEIVCAENITYERQRELIGATTPDSGKDTEVRPRLKSHFIVVTGATTSENDGNLSIFHFMDEDVEDEAQDLEIVFTDNNGNDISIRGDFYIENIKHDSPAGDSATYEIKFRGSGGVTVGELADPETTGESVTSDSYTIAGGVVQDNDWIGLADANIIEVAREGTELTSMGLSYSFDSVTGTITPDPDTTIDGQKLFVIWTY